MCNSAQKQKTVSIMEKLKLTAYAIYALAVLYCTVVMLNAIITCLS